MDTRKILSILNPQPAIGGLKISDLHMRYVRVKAAGLATAFLKLAPGIIKEGKVKDREGFINALKELHSQISKKSKEKISIIVTLPDDNVYIEVFGLPQAAGANLEEAAHLNLQMISPIDFNNSYSDWQLIGEKIVDGNQLEVLGAFIQKEIVDDFEHCLKEAGFVVVAIECPAFSLSRLAIEEGANVENKDAYILLQIGTNGLGFNVIRRGNFCFNHFVPWQSVYGEKRETSLADFKNIIINEIQRVLKFYENHWGGQINNLLLVSPRLNQEVSQIISGNFPIQVQMLALKRFRELEPVWFSALGSALRGLIPRSKDIIISLASVGTEKEFYQQRVLSFARIWRNIVIAAMCLVFVIFLAADIFIIRTIYSLNRQLAGSVRQPEVVELNNLKEEAQIFNNKVALALAVNKEKINWAPFLEKIKNLAGSDIVFQRIFAQSLDAPALISGRAINEEAALDFQKALSGQPQFENVDLPLASLIQTAGGVNFSVSFRIKNLQF